MSLQEKFQILTPAAPNEDDGNTWKDFSSAREVKSSDCCHQNNRTSADDVEGNKYNFLPPGMEISNQERAQIESMPLSMAGQTDVSADTNPEAFAQGFKRRQMKGADDLYSGEHVDLFYGEAIGDDGNEGFVERNNYLDRI